jgi:parvulin-like peptidyl-prolyl isomerase
MTRFLLVGTLVWATACADLTAPSGAAPLSSGAPAAAPPAGTEVVARPARPAGDMPTPRPQGDRIRASHILFAYQGAQRAKATRSKEEAKKLATQALGRVKGGADFGALAKGLSDDEGSKVRDGDLGQFERGGMVKPFADAAFALPVGGISEVVETEFGFHVIKRTE